MIITGCVVENVIKKRKKEKKKQEWINQESDFVRRHDNCLKWCMIPNDQKCLSRLMLLFAWSLHLLLLFFVTLWAVNDRWSHANVTSTKSSSSRRCRKEVSIDDWKSFHFSAYCWSDGVGDEMSILELWLVSCVYIDTTAVVIVLKIKVRLVACKRCLFRHVFHSSLVQKATTEQNVFIAKPTETSSIPKCWTKNIFLRSQIDTKAHYLDTFYDAFFHFIRHCVESRDGRECKHEAVLSYVLTMLRMCLAFN